MIASEASEIKVPMSICILLYIISYDRPFGSTGVPNVKWRQRATHETRSLKFKDQFRKELKILDIVQ